MLVCVTVLAFDRPDVVLVFLEGVDMDHPVEDHREKGSVGSVAGFPSGDGSIEAELWIGAAHLFEAAQRRDAEIHVLMPLRYAEWNSLIELIFG